MELIETGDAQVQYYHGAEMSKLTDSEGEYIPADDEWNDVTQPGSSPRNEKMGRLDSFLNDLDNESDGSGFFFSEDEDKEIVKAKKITTQRNLEEGQNLNNSFGCYSPEDWEHLHVDKGPNPQFLVLKNNPPQP